MDHLFDEIARILASPMPRRQAFRLLGGALVGGIVGALGIKQAAAQGASCGNGTCASGQKCCPGRAGVCTAFCADVQERCCGCVRCPETQRCSPSQPETCV